MQMSDQRFAGLAQTIANLASATGQWPEAINPITGGGCMGDGQHIWSAAEWVMFMINSIAMEYRDSIILGAGIFPQWLKSQNVIQAGPIRTNYGQLDVEIKISAGDVTLSWKAQWYSAAPKMFVRIPAAEFVEVHDAIGSIKLKVAGSV